MLRWLMIGAVLCVGCEGKTPPKSSGASHWLLPCAVDADCGAALACLCGQCSASCDADSDAEQDACPVGICVADACGGASVCRPAPADEAVIELDEMQTEGPDGEGQFDPPRVDADNPDGVWQFHRPSIVDANVLELRADGTFIYTLGGCDAVECAWGHWETRADGIHLRPPEGEAGFRWPDEFALETVSAVVLSPNADGVAARVTAADRADFAQDWRVRGLAVDCIDWSVSLSDAPAEPQSCSAPAYPDL